MKAKFQPPEAALKPRAGTLVIVKWGGSNAVQCNKCYTMQHEIEKRLLVAGTGLPPAKTPEAT